ncbi:energy transducer TonB family protein [Roseovarius aquimarinus]|uniref:Energy transducer TonB n=1 Tax=Roseovarius aquimarinus TaxID=1229156 RepID=A0ABW7I5N1_9RHOB
MIASSLRVKLAVGGLALAAHAGLGLWLAPQEQVVMESGGGEEVARIGTSFADMAAGTLTAERADDAIPAEAPPPPEPVAALRAETPEPTSAPSAAPTPAPSPSPAEAPAPAPAASAPSVAPSVPAVPGAAERIEAAEETAGAVTRSPRPVERSAAFERRNAPREPEPKPQPKPKPQQAAPRGNAETNATAGAAQGQDNARAETQGRTSAEGDAAGNAAAQNYPGAVMRKISGVRKPVMRRSGAARVSFTIGASGALAGLSIARSSGASELDREALRLIQRAAPFPAPPPGAQRSFALDVEFR